jgi:hypothetical protein
VQPFTAR